MPNDTKQRRGLRSSEACANRTQLQSEPVEEPEPAEEIVTRQSSPVAGPSTGTEEDISARRQSARKRRGTTQYPQETYVSTQTNPHGLHRSQTLSTLLTALPESVGDVATRPDVPVTIQLRVRSLLIFYCDLVLIDLQILRRHRAKYIQPRFDVRVLHLERHPGWTDIGECLRRQPELGVSLMSHFVELDA